jgi:thiamine-phosphate pyrophosphorylase
MSGSLLGARRLYLCTPDRPDLERFLTACIGGGVDLVQLRDPTLSDRQVLARARRARAVCAEHGVPFVLNDRPDLALEVEADGVHLGQDDGPPTLARRILGPNALVGWSTHAPEELEAASAEPVDYISAGPVEPTPTKPGRPGTGTGYVTLAAARAGRPVFVTGGVRPASVPALIAAGARRFVVVRQLVAAPDPAAAAAELRRCIDTAWSEPPALP